MIIDLVRTSWAWTWFMAECPLLKIPKSSDADANRIAVVEWLNEQGIPAIWSDDHHTFFVDFPDEKAVWLKLKY